MRGIPIKQADLEADLNAVLYYLCADWGYCDTGLSGADFIGQEFTADQITCRIMKAEGMNPESDIKHRRNLRRFFKDRYGDAISAQNYSVSF
jgi:hypothetical protein